MSQAEKDRFRNNPAKQMSLFLIIRHPNSPDLNEPEIKRNGRLRMNKPTRY